MNFNKNIILLVYILFFITSCTSINRIYNIITNDTSTLDADVVSSSYEIRAKIVEGAMMLINKDSVIVDGVKFNLDCTGTVLGAYYYAGIDLRKLFPEFTGGGVSRIYKSLEKRDLLYSTNFPLAGDIIFWDNTWDRNGDGKVNDYLTHIGLIISSDNNGNIEYMHHHCTEGIVIEKMNLLKPDVFMEVVNGKQVEVNSPMRMRGSPNYDKWLSSQLYKVFGMAYLIEP